jgi:hypothetical protein
MIRIETAYTFNEEILKRKKCTTSDLIVKSLKALGFRNILTNRDKIVFKNWIKDPELESFQRRYGNGSIIIDSEQNIRIVSKDKVSIPAMIIGNLFAVLYLNYQVIINSKSNLAPALMISAILILTGYSGIKGTRAKYKAKHQELIHEIGDKANKIVTDDSYSQ